MWCSVVSRRNSLNGSSGRLADCVPMSRGNAKVYLGSCVLLVPTANTLATKRFLVVHTLHSLQTLSQQIVPAVQMNAAPTPFLLSSLHHLPSPIVLLSVISPPRVALGQHFPTQATTTRQLYALLSSLSLFSESQYDSSLYN